MKTEITNSSKSKVEILFEMPWDEFEPYLDKAIAKLGKDLTLKGFRPGKAPRDFVEREVGQGKILSEGAELTIKEKYPEFVVERKLEVIGQPQVEVLKLAPGNPFSFKVKADVLPKLKLPDYKKIASQVGKKTVKVEEQEIEETLSFLQKSRAQFKDLERVAQKGDFVEIEYQSPEVENDKTYQDRFFLGKGHFIPGFEENLEGMKPGEEKEFRAVFPEDYFKKELSSKNASFKVKVKKVQSVRIPELNDSFAKDLGRFDDLEGLKKSLKQGIQQEKEVAENQRWREEVLDKIGEGLDFEAPEILVILEQGRILDEQRQKITNDLKTNFEDYLKNIKKTEDELQQSFLKEAKVRVKKFLILREIGKIEKIEVQPQEVEGVLNEFLKNYPSVEAAKKEVDLERLKDYYEDVIYNEKVMQSLAKT